MMKTAEQLCHFIASRIGYIYYRPLMYGGTPAGVDLILHYYHELWAEMMDMREIFTELSFSSHIEQGCGSADFSTYYSREHPTASVEDVTVYIVQQWKKMSEQLHIPIPYHELANIFGNQPTVLQYVMRIGLHSDPVNGS